jgi:hypothetical protein
VRDERVVRQLLDRGADPNMGASFGSIYGQGDTPPSPNSGATLNAAASHGTIAVIDLVI